MKWNSLDELPDNGSLVWVKLPNQDPIVRLFHNDSFGLGERDFQIIGWIPHQRETAHHLNIRDHKLLSTLQVWDRNNQHSSELSLSLVR
jgi:hypothetical protein